MCNIDMEHKLKTLPGKSYAHFDCRISIKTAWNYITNPQNIARHHFFPFIQFEKRYIKYNAAIGKNDKNRPICYSSHMDRCIYQYYAYQLNQKYNRFSLDNGFSESSVAYRNNLKKCNIDFAKQALNFIQAQQDCYIIVGDFTKFFESLNHMFLKKQLCTLLNCKSLSADIYAVYKNITKYSSWSLQSLLALNNLENTSAGRRLLNSKKTVLSQQEFKEHKHKHLFSNKTSVGIPQGSAISAILANIYMMKFDKAISEHVKKTNGLYMRYSDDFIIILPQETASSFLENYNFIVNEIKKTPDLKLEPQKTQLYHFSSGMLTNCNTSFIAGSEPGKDILNYLGFSFNGKIVSIRSKTLSKYYYRMYRKIRAIFKDSTLSEKEKRIILHKVYLRYSSRGAFLKTNPQKTEGNFITYVYRAQKIFGVPHQLDHEVKRHMQKIRKYYKKLDTTILD